MLVGISVVSEYPTKELYYVSTQRIMRLLIDLLLEIELNRTG